MYHYSKFIHNNMYLSINLHSYIVEEILSTGTVDELSAAGVTQVSLEVIPETDIHGKDIHSEGSKTREQTVISNNFRYRSTVHLASATGGMLHRNTV